MIIPSTITARRTRRYTSTWYIHPTTRKHDFEPMDGGGGTFFNSDSHKSGSQSVQGVHFTSAFYKGSSKDHSLWAGILEAVYGQRAGPVSPA